MNTPTRIMTRALTTGLLLSSLYACSHIPEDIRATLPESMRGDTKALTDYPTPSLSGSWQDIDLPELSIAMNQSGSKYTFERTGQYRGIPVSATYRGTLEGRSTKVSYQAKYPGQLRAVKGNCFGVVSKDSTSIQLTCQDGLKNTYPLNLKKR